MTYFLSADTGNDSTGNGSQANPWLTIGKAHTEATSGDTIILLDSTNEYTWANQTFTKDLTLRGQQPDASGAILDGNFSGIQWTIQSHLIIDSLTFINRVAGGSWSSRMFYFNTSNVGLESYNCMYRDIEVGGRPNFLGQGFVTTNATSDEAITVRFQSNTFEDTVKSNNASLGAGATLFNFRGNVDCDLRLINNTFHFGDFTGEERVEILMNVVNSAGTNVEIYNNIFYSDSNQNIALVLSNNQTFNETFDNNFYYENGTGDLTNIPSGNDNVNIDPLFVDKSTNNYDLRPQSTLFGQGRML